MTINTQKIPKPLWQPWNFYFYEHICIHKIFVYVYHCVYVHGYFVIIVSFLGNAFRIQNPFVPFLYINHQSSHFSSYFPLSIPDFLYLVSSLSLIFSFLIICPNQIYKPFPDFQWYFVIVLLIYYCIQVCLLHDFPQLFHFHKFLTCISFSP